MSFAQDIEGNWGYKVGADTVIPFSGDNINYNTFYGDVKNKDWSTGTSKGSYTYIPTFGHNIDIYVKHVNGSEANFAIKGIKNDGTEDVIASVNNTIQINATVNGAAYDTALVYCNNYAIKTWYQYLS